MRLATWNVERPTRKSYVRNRRRQEVFQQVQADIWVLTETNRYLSPDTDFEGVFSATLPSLHHGEGEVKVAIWSRWPILRHVPTSVPEYSVCVEVATPDGAMMVFGTVIPYADTGVRTGQAKRWQRHYEVIQAVASSCFN